MAKVIEYKEEPSFDLYLSVEIQIEIFTRIPTRKAKQDDWKCYCSCRNFHQWNWDTISVNRMQQVWNWHYPCLSLNQIIAVYNNAQ